MSRPVPRGRQVLVPEFLWVEDGYLDFLHLIFQGLWSGGLGKRRVDSFVPVSPHLSVSSIRASGDSLITLSLFPLLPEREGLDPVVVTRPRTP